MMDIDAFDTAILRALQKNSRQTGQELSEVVGLSPAACLRRLQRLRQNGAIAREIAILAPDVLPEARLRVVVTLRLVKHMQRTANAFARRLRAHDVVETVLSVAGADDLVLLMAFPSIEAFTEFADTHFEPDIVAGYESRIVLHDLSAAA